ncbi:MAG TPA: molybdenum ABC transporter ATP-binding protein [Thermoanaerobaculia bacterium]|nr:molybdenum ABC transporter ATP-binding protein [Thermoanaerobaculia bacterium]
MDRAAPRATSVGVIELDLRLPLADFTLEVAARCASPAVAVLGPSGSGKTSLLESIAGLRRRVQGRIALDGVTLQDSTENVHLPPERRRIGYVPQDALLFPHLSAADNVRFGLSGSDAERTFAEAVDILEIGPLLPRFPATLSGGERQRVALARAVATQPRLLLFDEPLAAIDVELKARILPYLLRIRDERKIPLFYVTHNAGEAEALAGEALLLRKGRLEAHGATRSIVEQRLAEVDPSASFDNVLDGRIASEERDGAVSLELSGGSSLTVPASGAGIGQRAIFAVAPDEILVSLQPLVRVSARNVLAGEIRAIESLGSDAMVHADAAGARWRAHVTEAAVTDLQLAVGQPVWLAIKTRSFRRLR